MTEAEKEALEDILLLESLRIIKVWNDRTQVLNQADMVFLSRDLMDGLMDGLMDFVELRKQP